MRTITKITVLFLLGFIVLVGTSQAQNAVPPMAADSNMTTEMASGDVMPAPVYENGISAEMYYGADYGDYGGAYAEGCGLFPFVRDVAQTALSPVYFIASLFSAGVYPDCGCAPPYRRVYRDPCDQCGNWVGAPTLFGHPRQSCNSCEGNEGLNYSGNGENWDNSSSVAPESFQGTPVGPINNQPAPAAQPAPAPIKSGAFQMQSSPSRISVRAPVVPIQQNSRVPQNILGRQNYMNQKSKNQYFMSQNFTNSQENVISQNVIIEQENMPLQSNRVPMNNVSFGNVSSKPKMNSSLVGGNYSNQASFNRNQATFNRSQATFGNQILMGKQNLPKMSYSNSASVNHNTQTSLRGNQFNNNFGKDNATRIPRTGVTGYSANDNIAPAPYYQTKSNAGFNGTIIRQVSGNSDQYHQ